MYPNFSPFFSILSVPGESIPLCQWMKLPVVMLERLEVPEEMRNTGILSSAPPSNTLRLNFYCVTLFIMEYCVPTMLLIIWWWMCLTLTYFTASQSKSLIFFWCFITYKKCRTQFCILEILNMIANLELQTIERVHVHRKTYHIRRLLYILEISGCVLLV